MLFSLLFSVLASAAPAAAAPPPGVWTPDRGDGAYRNPVLQGDYSDPDAIRVGGDFYLTSSSFSNVPGLPVLHSKDLVNWEIIGHALPVLPPVDHYRTPRRGGGVWAPAIRYHAGRFYIYYPDPDFGIFMLSAADPAGPWSAPVLVDDDKGAIDPCPFWDDDGKAYLVHSKVGAGPLILHGMSPDGTRVLDGGKTIVEDKANLPTLEGPKVYKRNGYYYIFAPIGGVGQGPQAVLRARRIDGPYEARKVLLPGNGIEGPHQGGWVETPSGQGWFIHFNKTGAFGRIAHLQPVVWKDDWPEMGQGGLPVIEGPVPDTGRSTPADRLQDSDEFSAPALGLQWSWNHNPDDAHWSLTQRPGYLRLQANEAKYLVGARNVLTQILQGPASEITTRLELKGLGERQRAGLVLFGVGVPWVGVVHEDGRDYVTVADHGAETRIAPLDGKAVILRAAVAEDQTVRFSYARDGSDDFRAAGAPVKLAPFSWWKGSRPAVFTWIKGDTDAPRQGGGPTTIVRDYVDVDWFRVSPR